MSFPFSAIIGQGIHIPEGALVPNAQIVATGALTDFFFDRVCIGMEIRFIRNLLI